LNELQLPSFYTYIMGFWAHTEGQAPTVVKHRALV